MKRVKIITMVIIAAFAVLGVMEIAGLKAKVQVQQNKSEEIMETKQDLSASDKFDREKIVLNTLCMSAAGERVSDISLDGFGESFNVDTTIYKIENYAYSDKEVKKIANTLNTDIEEKDDTDDLVTQYDLSDGSYLAYYENSGGLIYIADTDTVDGVDVEKFDEDKCKKAAEKFIKKSQIIDFDDLEFQNSAIGESVETSDGTEVLSYVLTYKKVSPYENVEFYGVGPGIRVEVDSNYTVCGFTAVNKEIVEAVGEFETIDKDDLVDKICDGTGVQIDGTSDGETLDVSIDNMKICLYSDPMSLEQEYMAPYYVLEGEDANQNDITIVVPAVDDDSITYR